MRAVTAVVGAVVVSLALTASSVGAAQSTALRIAYWDEATGAAPDAVWTLRCSPPGGSLARPLRACLRLAAGGSKLFAPVPEDAVCTEIYGGPQRARVSGLLAGRRVWAIFTRAEGCEIARWNKLSPWLLPPGGVT